MNHPSGRQLLRIAIAVAFYHLLDTPRHCET